MEDKNLCFILSTCIQNPKHLRQLHRCVNSIILFFPGTPIFVVDDTRVSIELNFPDNITIIKSSKQGSADQQVFSVFRDIGYKKAVIIQDSMVLLNKFPVDDCGDINFMWYFTNHRRDWDRIIEPISGITHTELIRSRLYQDYSQNIDFLTFAMSRLNDKNLWCGAFGNCCVVTRESLDFLDSVVPFIDTMVTYTTNRLRRVNESILSLICHFVYNGRNFANSSVDGHYNNTNQGNSTNFDGLSWCHTGTYIGKVSFNR